MHTIEVIFRALHHKQERKGCFLMKYPHLLRQESEEMKYKNKLRFTFPPGGTTIKKKIFDIPLIFLNQFHKS